MPIKKKKTKAKTKNLERHLEIKEILTSENRHTLRSFMDLIVDCQDADANVKYQTDQIASYRKTLLTKEKHLDMYINTANKQYAKLLAMRSKIVGILSKKAFDKIYPNTEQVVAVATHLSARED